MKTPARDKSSKSKAPAGGGKSSAGKSAPAAAGGFSDLRPAATVQRKLAEAANAGPRMTAQRKQLGAMFGPAAETSSSAIQAKSDSRSGGLPSSLRSGIESLSGMSMANVNVHYNSSKPAQLNAHAYAQGNDIHLAPGQQRHLPHEAWHVVQQAQGRVKPTRQMKQGVAINDNGGLEHEADVMGAKAMSVAAEPPRATLAAGLSPAKDGPAQRIVVSGGDANPRSAAAVNKGIEAQISPMEVQLQLNIFTGRHQGMRSFTLPDLQAAAAPDAQKIQYDAVNYMVGHAEHDRGFMGLSADVMAAMLKGSGLKSGVRIMIIACNGALFASQLQAALAKLEVHVAVTGALGLVYGHAAASGRDRDAVEGVFNDQHPLVRDRRPGDAVKYDLARHYDNAMLNHIIGLGLHLLETAGMLAEGKGQGDPSMLKGMLQDFGFRLFKQLATLSLVSDNVKPPPVAKGKGGGGAAAASSSSSSSSVVATTRGKGGGKVAPPARYGSTDLVKFFQTLKSRGGDQIQALAVAVGELKNILAGAWQSAAKVKQEKGNYPFASLYTLLSRLQQDLYAAQFGDTRPARGVDRVQTAYHAYGMMAADRYIRWLMRHFSHEPETAMQRGWVTFLPGGGAIAHERWRDDVLAPFDPRRARMPMPLGPAGVAGPARGHRGGALVPYRGGRGGGGALVPHGARMGGGHAMAPHGQAPRLLRLADGWQMAQGVNIPDQMFHTMMAGLQASLPSGVRAEIVVHYKDGKKMSVHLASTKKKKGGSAARPLLLGAPPSLGSSSQMVVPASQEVIAFALRFLPGVPRIGSGGAVSQTPASHLS